MHKQRPIGPLVYRNYEFLSSVSRTKSAKKRKDLLKKATAHEILSIVEVAHNLLALDRKTGKPVFHLTNRQRAKLIPLAAVVRKIGRSRTERGARRHIQRGGGLPALIPLLAPVLIQVAKSLLSNGS